MRDSFFLGEDILREMEFKVSFLISICLKYSIFSFKLFYVYYWKKFYLYLDIEDMISEIRVYYCENSDMYM